MEAAMNQVRIKWIKQRRKAGFGLKIYNPYKQKKQDSFYHFTTQ